MATIVDVPKGWKTPNFENEVALWHREDLRQLTRNKEQRGHAPELIEWAHLYIHQPFSQRLDELSRDFPEAITRIKALTSLTATAFAIWLTQLSYYDQIRVVSGLYAYNRTLFDNYSLYWASGYHRSWRRRMIRYVLRFEDQEELVDLPPFRPVDAEFVRLHRTNGRVQTLYPQNPEPDPALLSGYDRHAGDEGY